MKVVVIFDFPDIDVDSGEVDDIINELENDLDSFMDDTGHICYIDGYGELNEDN